MKVFVAHDEDGRIHAVFVPAADLAEDVALEPEAGERVSELEIAELDDHRDDERIRMLVEGHRVVNGALVKPA